MQNSALSYLYGEKKGHDLGGLCRERGAGVFLDGSCRHTGVHVSIIFKKRKYFLYSFVWYVSQ